MAEEFTAPWWGLTKFCDPLRIPSVIEPRGDLTIRMSQQEVQLHSQLPPTSVWTFDGQFPGPTIDVRRCERIRVAWVNDIEGTMPFTGVKAVPAAEDDKPTDRPGREGFDVIGGLDELPAWTVTHLHGARTNAGNDGWAHNAGLSGSSQLVEYPNDQPAMTLWYHDHAMAITRFNVFSGLAGMYLVRDEEELSLELPSGDREIPLIICDRNLDTHPDTGELTGQLLFKAQAAGADLIPFTGPFSLVNGVIWPHLTVDPVWYRFRLLNASNSRFYTLSLVDDDGRRHDDAVRLIGTDGGLLPVPTEMPKDGLVVAPAERFDLLIDFSRFAGRNLRLTNLAGDKAPEPDLMEFRVDSAERPEDFEPPATISPSYVRLQHGTTVPAEHEHVWVALEPGTGMPEMWDLTEIARTDAGPGDIHVVSPEFEPDGIYLRKVGKMFDDTVGVFLKDNDWAVWNIIHLGGPDHPIHIHLTEFQALFRRHIDVTAREVVAGADIPLEKYEEGWKDTIIVRKNEWVSVAGQFVGGSGEFMFHCHILDHEDEGMMRPFVVRPKEVAVFDKMGMPGMPM